MTDLAPRLLAWFDQHGRHDLPWQHPRSPYRVWLSEVMLQQTQVATVIPYFNRFVERLPSLQTLAAAPLDEVLALWSGLGYYRRAHNLHAAAKTCVVEHAGTLPDTFTQLIALPGIGRSTAGAILAQAFDQPWPILDGNARRVLIRFHGVRGWHGRAAVQKLLWEHAQRHLPKQHAANYTQAMMDLGATLCTRHAPDCASCPLTADCAARHNGLTALLPERAPRRVVPLRETQMLIVRRPDAHIWLRRRPPAGIWPQLWALPEMDTAACPLQTLQREGISAAVHSQTVLPAFIHVFTHFRLAISPLLVEVDTPERRIADNDRSGWFAAHQLRSMGIPAPLRRLLDHINEETK